MAEETFDLISMAEIARIAGQSRSTVGNWKARDPDEFPVERGRSARGPLYDRGEVTSWLLATSRLDVHRSSAAVLWDVANEFRDQLATEDILPLVLILLALMAEAPEGWVGLKAHPERVEEALRSLVGQHLPDVEVLLPHPGIPAQPLMRAIDIVSGLDPSHIGALTDAALEQAAQALGHRGGEFLSPRSIRELVVSIAQPAGTIYNPGTGAGQLLVDAASAAGKSPSTVLVGQEINVHSRAIALLNLELHELQGDIALGDIFADDCNPDLRADVVLSVPPWNQRLADAERLRDDQRWIWGEPGPGDGNSAWIQHCLAHLGDHGRAVLVLPNGVLFEAGRSGRIRQRIIKAGLLDAVLALPPRLFPWTNIACAVLVFRKGRAEEVGGKPAPTLMLDLTTQADTSERGANELSKAVIDDVGELYRRWVQGSGPDAQYAAVADYEAIVANDFVIDPGRYLALPAVEIDRDQIVQRQRELVGRFSSLCNASREADDHLRSLLEPRS